jgi:predicted nicotinamide N-methyase
VLTTALLPVPLAPEISLHLADAGVGLFDATGGEFRSDEPPPFWAFVWAGGQALARYVLDHPETVRGLSVLDLAAGSGVGAIAAATAGAAQVTAADIDPTAGAAIRRNAAANAVSVSVSDDDRQYDVVLAGDAFYSASVAEQMTTLLRAHARRGARVLVGDPGRGYFPGRLFHRLAEYPVPVPAALEETETLVTGVYEMRTTFGPG